MQCVRSRKPRADPWGCLSLPLVASVGPLLAPGRSKPADSDHTYTPNCEEPDHVTKQRTRSRAPFLAGGPLPSGCRFLRLMTTGWISEGGASRSPWRFQPREQRTRSPTPPRFKDAQQTQPPELGSKGNPQPYRRRRCPSCHVREFRLKGKSPLDAQGKGGLDFRYEQGREGTGRRNRRRVQPRGFMRSMQRDLSGARR